jgi:hypothetical protein
MWKCRGFALSLLVFLFLAAQAMLSAHALEHGLGDCDEAGTSCALCLAAEQQGTALPPALVAIPEGIAAPLPLGDLPSCADAVPLPARQRGPPHLS